MNETIYRGSKAKVALMGLFILGVFVVSIPLYFVLEWLSSQYSGFIITVAWVLISLIPILVALGLIITIISLLFGKYALTLNETGVVAETSFGKKQELNWEDINGLELKQRFFNRAIVVKLKDNEAYISKLSPLMKKGIPAMMTRFGSPCILEVGLAEGKATDILAEMQRFLEQYGSTEEDRQVD